jgi:hypothetical protein
VIEWLALAVVAVLYASRAISPTRPAFALTAGPRERSAAQ